MSFCNLYYQHARLRDQDLQPEIIQRDDSPALLVEAVHKLCKDTNIEIPPLKDRQPQVQHCAALQNKISVKNWNP